MVYSLLFYNGINMTYQGEMGKGGKAPVEAKDNLVSDQIAKTLFVVGEGVIDGVDNV